MTTLRRERIQKFALIIRTAVYKYYGAYMDEAEVLKFAESLADAAASRTEVQQQEVVIAADRKVDAIIELDKQAKAAEDAGQAWRGREFLAGSEYCKYGDWYHKKTGWHMYGAKSKPKQDGTIMAEFKTWWENDITIDALDIAYKIENDWRKDKSGLEQNITHPRELTAKAKTIQASGQVNSPSQPAQKVYTPEEEPQYVPAPQRKP